MVSVTWASPSPNTMRRIARSWASENSRPIENIRNTTPNSASAVGGGAIVGQLQRMRSDQYADGQVTQHRGQVEHPERNHAQDGAAQQKKS
jgi:hypothetical protein